MFDNRGTIRWPIRLLSGWCLAFTSFSSFFAAPLEACSPTISCISAVTPAKADFSDTAVQQNSPKVIEADLHAKSVLRNMCALGRFKLGPNLWYPQVAKRRMLCVESLVELGVALRL